MSQQQQIQIKHTAAATKPNVKAPSWLTIPQEMRDSIIESCLWAKVGQCHTLDYEFDGLLKIPFVAELLERPLKTYIKTLRQERAARESPDANHPHTIAPIAEPSKQFIAWLIHDSDLEYHLDLKDIPDLNYDSDLATTKIPINLRLNPYATTPEIPVGLCHHIVAERCVCEGCIHELEQRWSEWGWLNDEIGAMEHLFKRLSDVLGLEPYETPEDAMMLFNSPLDVLESFKKDEAIDESSYVVY